MAAPTMTAANERRSAVRLIRLDSQTPKKAPTASAAPSPAAIFTTCFSARNNFFFGSREDLLFYYDAYVRLMDHWRMVLPPDRFLELDYEALVEDREAQTRRLIAFCGLEWDRACMRPERNDRVISTASLWQARQPVYRGAIGRWRNYSPWLGSLLRLAPTGAERDA